MRPSLTIGYLTYSRAEAIEAAVEQTLRQISGLPVELVVADNASADNTVERLVRRFGDKRVRLIAGERNLGWEGNVRRLAESASSEHLLLMSDEDDVEDTSVLWELLGFLSGPRRLSLVTTGENFQLSRKGRRGASDLWESVHYISGTIFGVSELLNWLDRLDDIARRHDIAELRELYPHFMIAAGIWLTGGDCAHFGKNVHVAARNFPMRWRPAHRDLGDRELARTNQDQIGRAYTKSLSSNVLQHAALAVFLDCLSGSEHTDKKRLCDMRRWQEDRIASKVDKSLAYFYPEVYPTWRRGIKRRYSLGMWMLTAFRGFARLPGR